jgi:hypothetical protein
VAVGDVKGLAAGIVDAWEHREPLGRAASETIRTHYDKSILYARLANSLREIALQSGPRE